MEQFDQFFGQVSRFVTFFIASSPSLNLGGVLKLKFPVRGGFPFWVLQPILSADIHPDMSQDKKNNIFIIPFATFNLPTTLI